MGWNRTHAVHFPERRTSEGEAVYGVWCGLVRRWDYRMGYGCGWDLDGTGMAWDTCIVLPRGEDERETVIGGAWLVPCGAALLLYVLFCPMCGLAE